MLHYQPTVDLGTGVVTGAEALVRWQHRERGLIAPDRFVPLAEQTGMIRPLTRWVLEEALRQCGAWRAAGRELSVAVNLSVDSLLDPDLARDIAPLLRRYNVPPRLLVLEITENSVMRDPATSVRILDDLRAMGVRISVDDFGTGYSSLVYLTRLPIHEIKIDRTFVMNMEDRHEDAIIFRSTVDLGHNLGLKVIAEGVETDGALTGLRDLGCDSAQGFHIGRPLPASGFDDWLLAHETGATRRRAGV